MEYDINQCTHNSRFGVLVGDVVECAGNIRNRGGTGGSCDSTFQSAVQKAKTVVILGSVPVRYR